jgi:hypothetical protein
MCLPVDRPARALTSRAAARIAAVIRRNPNPPIARETLIKGLVDLARLSEAGDWEKARQNAFAADRNGDFRSRVENETLAAVPAPAIGTASPITRTPPGDPGS